MTDKVEKKGFERSSERTGETREKILNAAIRLFSRRGYRGTSVADIATDAGVAKSAVFWHFGTKNGLLDTLAGKLVSGNVQKMVQEIISGKGTDEADLINTFLTHFQHKLETEPELNRAYFLLMIESAVEDREAEKPFAQALNSYHRFMTTLIKTGQK